MSSCADLDYLYYVTGIILCILLIVSEILGWSECEANSITQLYKYFHSCYHSPRTPTPSPPIVQSTV